MASSSTVYLVSGANRGIGLEFINTLARRPNTIVFAGARNPSVAIDLNTLAAKYPDRVHVVQLVSGEKEGNARVIEKIKQTAGRLDVVIANAGICQWMGPLVEAPAETMTEHFNVNVVGTLVLFQAAYSLMKASPTKKFVAIGAGAGSISRGPDFGYVLGPYACSKAAEHFLAKKLQFENEDFVIFPICPGRVVTDMYGNAQANDPLLAKEPGKTPEESVRGLMAVIDNATRENAGGKFMDVSGGINEW
ncbi:hypothetical protein BD626DRAFT_438812 [Schizophyllum amplum]|uniref:NAD(P)-binding protein n=1 Tax=Schizophyllum amplum TaxID=97359 RepID=A0A550BZE6_9AGAR|nr:hypothetical protein BD626DRAFT_438812 [Auriculariopsis ampla]